MNFFLLLSSLIFVSNSVLAQNSFTQTSCRSGDNSLQIEFGDNQNQVLILERTYQNSAQPVEKALELSLEEIRLQYSQTVRIEGRAVSTCNPYGTEGEKEWYNIRAQKVRIEKIDGSTFQPGVVGVSRDLRSVESFVICEEQGHSEIECGPQWQREEPAPETLQSGLL